jgi:hypothetical protein
VLRMGRWQSRASGRAMPGNDPGQVCSIDGLALESRPRGLVPTGGLESAWQRESRPREGDLLEESPAWHGVEMPAEERQPAEVAA